MDDAFIFSHLSGTAYGFVLVLARLGAVAMLAPGLGEAQIPAKMRAAFAALLTLLVMPFAAANLAPPAHPLIALRDVAAELLTGLWFGCLTRFVSLALPTAAQIVSYLTGLSSVLLPDLTGANAQAAVLSRFFALAPAVLVLASGLYALPLTALVQSFRLIPPGALLPPGDATHMIVQAAADSFTLAVRLAAPFIAAGAVLQIALGLLARLVPPLQIYHLAMPGQVLGGLLLLALSVPAMLAAWSMAASESPGFAY